MSPIRARRPLSAARLEAALAYWHAKRRGRPMPTRADVDPVDIPDLLPNVILVEVLSDPLDFRFRLMGTAIAAELGADHTGRRFSELWPNAAVSRLWADHQAVVGDCRPLDATVPYDGPNEDVRSARHLLLPLATADGWAVGMVFGLVEYDRVDADPRVRHRLPGTG